MREAMRPSGRNYILILGVICFFVLVSATVGDIVYKNTGISGRAWLGVAAIWSIAIFFISYFEGIKKELDLFSAFFQSAIEVILLNTIAIIIMFFLKYNIKIGISLMGVYTLARIMSANIPIFMLKEKVIYEELESIEKLEKAGAWIEEGMPKEEITRQIQEEEPSKVPIASPKKEEYRTRKQEKVLKIRLTDKDKKALKKDQDKLKKSATGLLSLKEGEIPPEDMHKIIELVEAQVRMKEGEEFIIPVKLSRGGIDSIPSLPKEEKNLVDMDSKEKIKMLMLSAQKDMAKYFNMKLKAPVELIVDFPWETKRKMKKLSSKVKMGHKWLLNICGGLKEDITYAILAAHLADIWLRENGSEKVYENWASGFYFWIVYKMAKKRGYIKAAIQSTKQAPKQFEFVRKIEEKAGEYGVLYWAINGELPYYVKKDQSAIDKDKTEKPQKISTKHKSMPSQKHTSPKTFS